MQIGLSLTWSWTTKDIFSRDMAQVLRCFDVWLVLVSTGCKHSHDAAQMMRNSDEIMVLFVLCKLILQMLMHNHPVGLDAWFLVGPFVYFHISCLWTVKALARLRRCTGSAEPSLVACVIRTIVSWAGSFIEELLNELFNLNLSNLNASCIQMSHDTTKRVFGSFRPGQTQTGLRSHRS